MIFDKEYVAKYNGEYYPAKLVELEPITFAVEIKGEDKNIEAEYIEVYVKVNFNQKEW